MLENVCFSESEYAFKEYFLAPTIIYNVLLALLLIFSIIVATYYFRQLPSTRDEDSDSLAREAKEQKVDGQRILAYILLIYDDIQLITIPLFQQTFFTSSSSDDDGQSFLGALFGKAFEIAQYITLRFSSWVPLALFIFFYFITFVTNIIRFRDDRIKQPRSHSALSQDIKNFVVEVLLCSLYIPATRSFLQMMVCEYTCSYFRQPASFKPYPPMVQYHKFSCVSPGFIVLYFLAFIRILHYHPVTLRFVAFEKNQSQPVMRFHPRFYVVYFEIKFLLLFASEIIRIPQVVLAAHMIIFLVLFIAQIRLQPCLGFGLRVNNLQSA
ncbi:MAG: hypothetical protein EZS28_030563, partial [Streblomastix strix]